MSTIERIMKRASIRAFKDREVSDEDLENILKAAMSGPTAMNKRDWQFIVIKNKDTLNTIAEIIGKSADPLKGAAAAILICGDLERAFGPSEDSWIVDCAIAAQNALLAADELGLGAVYLGVWPGDKKMNGLVKYFNLDEDEVMPHSIVCLGYPGQDDAVRYEKPEWEASQVHYEKW